MLEAKSDRPQVLGISGSLRQGSSNERLLKAIGKQVEDRVDWAMAKGMGDLPHFNPDLEGEGKEPPRTVQAWRDQLSQADAFVISSPEYAHNVPGSLKNALDWVVSSGEFVDKPVLIINASFAGGEHVQASLSRTLRVMSAKVLERENLSTGIPPGSIDAKGNITNEALRQRIEAGLTALVQASRRPSLPDR